MSKGIRQLLIIGVWLYMSTLTLSGQSEKLNVVATASMISDMVEQIAGENVNLKCIVPIGGDPHIYEATPQDARIIASADIIFRNGLTFEGWLNELIENAGSKATLVTVTEDIKPIESLIYQNATDPHAWMDARNGLKYITTIKNALIAADPQHEAIYQSNYESYYQELEELDQYIMDQVQRIPKDRRILITSHDAFQYYGRRYDIRLESVLGTSTDADIQTSDIIRLNRVIRENNVPAVFIESTINPKILEQLASDNKIKIGGKLYADSIGDADSPANSYVNMLRHNTNVIVEALTATAQSEDSIPSKRTTSAWLYGIIVAAALLIMVLLIFRFSK